MLLHPHIFRGFMDSVSQHTQNLSFVAWVIYSHSGQLVSYGGAYLGFATNNIVEYSTVIELLSNSNYLGIQHLLVHIDS